MEAILDSLCKIKDMRVVSRNSVEQYRNNPKPTPVVAEEMNVGYILEGSGHRDGNNVRLHVQLLDGKKDQHLWSKIYNSDIEEIFSMQSEIAQLVAAEIKAIITPEEKQIIENVPTHSLTSYDFYQRGREAHIRYRIDYYYDIEELEKAEYFYTKALEYDSTFAQAYTGLSWIYYDKIYYSTDFKNDILDSTLIRTDVALSLNDQQEEAYLLRASIYRRKGDFQKAKENYEIALSINPNFAYGLGAAGQFYIHDIYDYVKGFSNLHKAASIDRSPYLSVILRTLSTAYSTFGFVDNAIFYNQEAAKLDNDSIAYYMRLSGIEYNRNNHIDVVNNRLKAYMLDSNNTYAIDLLASSYGSGLGKFEESLRYWEKYLALIKARGDQIANRSYAKIGLTYWQNG